MGEIVSILKSRHVYSNICSASRNVALWEIEEYIPWSQLDPIIDLSNLRGHLGRSVVSLGLVRTKAWATILIKAVGICSNRGCGLINFLRLVTHRRRTTNNQSWQN